MLVKLENPTLLSKAVDIISELVTEVRIKVNGEGMSITAIDPANVAMVGFNIKKNSFSQFETDGEILGVNLESLKRILRRCDSKSSLILEKRGENLLNITIQDVIKRNFILSLIDIESESREMPELDFNTKVEINSDDLITSIEDCIVVSDACSFIINNGKFIIESRGLDSATSEFSGEKVKIEGEDFKSRYSLEYLSKFIKGAKLCDKTILKSSNNHPLRLEFRNEQMELVFILAPRVEDED